MIAGLKKRCFAALVISCGVAAAQPVTGITFATSPGKLYLPLAEASRELDWSLRRNKLGFQLNSRVLDSGGLRRLVDGTVLVSVDELAGDGAVLLTGEPGQVVVQGTHVNFTISAGPKRVEINLANQ